MKFVELNISEVYQNGNLIETLERLKPSSVQMINLLHIKDKQLFAHEKILHFKFYSYEEDSKKDFSRRNWDNPTQPLFLVCEIKTDYSMDSETNFCYRHLLSRETPNPDDKELLEEFSSLFNFLPNSICFGTIDARYVPFLEKVSTLHGKKAKVYPNWTMYLPKEKVAVLFSYLKCPEGYELKAMDPESHAQVISAHWKFGEPGAIPHIADQIKNSPSAGFFHKESNDIVAWVISMLSGTINALHCKEGHRRKGLGDLAMKNICIGMVEKGLYPLVEIEPETPSSKALMDKLGFELAFDAAWVYCRNVQ